MTYRCSTIADMTTVDERMTTLETEFRTELRHLATKTDLERVKSDLERAKWQLGGLMIGTVGIATTIIAIMLRFWS